MNYLNKFMILIAFNIILLIGGIILFYNSQDTEIVYIENLKAFENFSMTLELKKRGERELQAQRIKVDSLYKLISSPPAAVSKENLMKTFIEQKELLDNFTAEFADVQSAKIWKRIYGYADEFAKEYNYKLVLGMQPNENIIYGSNSINVTNDFVRFINSKYEGN